MNKNNEIDSLIEAIYSIKIRENSEILLENFYKRIKEGIIFNSLTEEEISDCFDGLFIEKDNSVHPQQISVFDKQKEEKKNPEKERIITQINNLKREREQLENEMDREDNNPYYNHSSSQNAFEEIDAKTKILKDKLQSFKESTLEMKDPDAAKKILEKNKKEMLGKNIKDNGEKEHEKKKKKLSGATYTAGRKLFLKIAKQEGMPLANAAFRNFFKGNNEDFDDIFNKINIIRATGIDPNTGKTINVKKKKHKKDPIKILNEK